VLEVLALSTRFWALSVWTKEVENSRAKYIKTLTSRGGRTSDQEVRLPTQGLQSSDDFSIISDGCINLHKVVFFENKSYEFEFLFEPDVSDFKIVHIQTAIEEAFRKKSNEMRGVINFGNDIGWFKLQLNFRYKGSIQTEAISFQVLPTKLDMTTDIEKIHSLVDEIYPLWRFSFAKKTNQELNATRKPHEKFQLLWLAQFESLRKKLITEVKTICNAPHNRLQFHTKKVRIDRLRGKLPNKIERKILESLAGNEIGKRFNVDVGSLSVDTMENRFVKMALISMERQINKISMEARKRNQSPDKDVISESFFSKLHDWQDDIGRLLYHQLFSEVGKLNRLNVDSQVLFKRAGYSGFYRIWQELKAYLDVFGDSSAISVKSVSELYEIWCLLEVRRNLLVFGFIETLHNGQLYKKFELEKMLKDSIGATFNFERNDGVKVRLAHEPVFGKPDRRKKAIFSWNAKQKPDIVLQVIFPNNERIHWVFDAKYRVENDGFESELDYAPEDALNQMHRYRDALVLQQQQADGTLKRSRPVIGAYVLYPGWYPDSVQLAEKNQYADAIEAVNIGAFPALPGQENIWLREFLNDNLNIKMNHDAEKLLSPEKHLSIQAVQIPPSGLTLVRDV
jgi:predicted component of viral defense system (DUF524 family)